MQGGRIMGMVRLKQFIVKLKRQTSPLQRVQPSLDGSQRNDGCIPNDVKDGHFAVLAGNGEETKRFLVDLKHLKNPDFLRILDRAYDEYGFRHEGLLVVPCSPNELQKILVDGM